MAHQIEKKSLKAAPQISPVMRALSAYVASALRRPLPPAVLEKTKHHLLDTLAAMLSGSRLPPGKKAISFAKILGGTKEDRKSTRLNSSHSQISYAVFCLKKKRILISVSTDGGTLGSRSAPVGIRNSPAAT